MKTLSQLAFTLLMIISLSLFTGVNTTNAQVGDTDITNSSCVELSNNMRYRMRDSSVNNEVSDLQDYLIAEGYMSGNTTGYFGVATLKAVKSFQSNNGLLSSGYVGPVTRAKIKSLSCDTAYSNPVIPSNPAVITPNIPGMAKATYYFLNSNKDGCAWGIYVGNMASELINGQYVYQTGQYKTEAECKSANGLSYTSNTGNGMVYITYYSYNTVYKMCTENIYMGNTEDRVKNGQYVYRTGEYKTEQECKTANGLSSNPVACTMEYRSCPDGTGMYRDANCGWHPEMCRDQSNSQKVNISSIAAVPNPSYYGASDVTLFNMTITGSNFNQISYLQEEHLVDGQQSITRSSFTSATDNQISFNLKVCQGCKYTSTFNAVDRNGIKSNVISVLIDNTVPVPANALKAASAKLYNVTGFTNNYGNLYQTYSPGETIKFSIQGYDSNGQVATPAKGFHVQWHMYENYDNPNIKATTMINGTYQADNAVFNYNTNMWDITAIAPSSNLPTGSKRMLEASFYCSQKGLGCYENQIETSFVFSINSAMPTVTSSFSSNQLPGYTVASTYNYQIQNYRDGLVLDVELRTADCLETGGYRKDCSKYLFTLSGKAAESYYNVMADNYVKGGASYRFTGSNGQINITSFPDPSYFPVYPYINPTPLNIYYKFVLRDTKNGGAEVWSETKSFGFPG